jgi:hypothetical protein
VGITAGSRGEVAGRIRLRQQNVNNNNNNNNKINNKVH